MKCAFDFSRQATQEIVLSEAPWSAYVDRD